MRSSRSGSFSSIDTENPFFTSVSLSSAEQSSCVSTRSTFSSSSFNRIERMRGPNVSCSSVSARPGSLVRMSVTGLRRRMSSIFPSAAIWPWFRMAMFEHIFSISPSMWLVTSTVAPRSVPRLRMRLRISTMPFGSRPFVGSSRITKLESGSSASVIASRCFMPSENSRTRWFIHPAIPVYSASSSRRARYFLPWPRERMSRLRRALRSG